MTRRKCGLQTFSEVVSDLSSGIDEPAQRDLSQTAPGTPASGTGAVSAAAAYETFVNSHVVVSDLVNVMVSNARVRNDSEKNEYAFGRRCFPQTNRRGLRRSGLTPAAV